MILLESLCEIARQISLTRVSASTLQTVCQNLVQVLSLHYAAVIRWGDVVDSAATIAEYPSRPRGDSSAGPLVRVAYERLQVERAPVVVEPKELSGLKTALVVPLLVQGEMIGGLALASGDASREFSPEERQAVQVIAAQVALGLRNSSLVADIQRHANQLELSTNFGRLVTSTFDRDKIFRHIVDVIPSLLPADQVSITLYTAGDSQMQQVILTLEGVFEKVMIPAAGSGVEEVVQAQTPMLITDLQSSNFTDHQRLSRLGFRSLMIVPLAIGKRTLGTLDIAHRAVDRYTPTELTLVQQFGNQIAIALENAHQFHTTQHRAAYEEALSEITSRLQEQSDLRNLLVQALKDLGQTLGAHQARVRLQPHAGPGRSHSLQSKG